MSPDQDYDTLYRTFRWQLPQQFNIGVAACDRWAAADSRPALIYIDAHENAVHYGFTDLKRLSNRLANTLKASGVRKGTRVGILLPQCPETLIAHIAVYKLGAIAVPLLTLFGPMALEYRLSDCQAAALILRQDDMFKLDEIRSRLPHLKTVLVVGSTKPSAGPDFWQCLNQGSRHFEPVATNAEDPAVIIYTSGTTGPPKGTLHAHRLLLGILPGFTFFHNLFPQAGDLMYTPLDWAYIGGSFDALFPALYCGVPVLAFRPPKFDPEKALYIMEKYSVRNLMAVPTVLRMMMESVPASANRCRTSLRSITAGGETLGNELYEWSKQVLNVELNEHYGQTECDLTVGFCSAVMPVVKGAIGKPAPGHVVEVIDEAGRILPAGEVGQIAVKKPDPVMFLKYWNRPEATAGTYCAEWLLTGDFAEKDDCGHFWFAGRKDDIIESGGYRIGPGEIEGCLMAHPAVSMVCVLGVPDEIRGQAVKAFVVPKAGHSPGPALETDIRRFVKDRLEAHAYPRHIEFLDRMPTTKTGKILKSELKKELR